MIRLTGSAGPPTVSSRGDGVINSLALLQSLLSANYQSVKPEKSQDADNKPTYLQQS